MCSTQDTPQTQRQAGDHTERAARLGKSLGDDYSQRDDGRVGEQRRERNARTFTRAVAQTLRDDQQAKRSRGETSRKPKRDSCEESGEHARFKRSASRRAG